MIKIQTTFQDSLPYKIIFKFVSIIQIIIEIIKIRIVLEF